MSCIVMHPTAILLVVDANVTVHALACPMGHEYVSRAVLQFGFLLLDLGNVRITLPELEALRCRR